MFALIRYQWIIDRHLIGYFPREGGFNLANKRSPDFYS